MTIGNFTKRGIICLIIAILYIVASVLYYYYLTKNEPVNKENYNEQKIYGPNIFFVVQIAILFASMILYLVIAYINFGKWRTSFTSNKHLHDSCDNYQTLREYIFSKF